MLLPARVLPQKRVQFPATNVWGVDLKIAVREVAKKLPLYRTHVQLEPVVSGCTDEGKRIPIDTIGKWLFGTPGYKGNMVVESFEEYISFRLPDVPEAEKLIRQAVAELLEGGRGK